VKSKWLHKRNSNKLIIFCNGWGMDERPLAGLDSQEWNVLMFYDYVDLVPDQDLEELLSSYEETALIAWSMGVWVGQQVFNPYRQQLQMTLAVNGTLCPIDDQFGIPKDLFQATLEHFNEKQRLKFYHRMCRDRTIYRDFLRDQPARSVENQKKELSALLKSAGCQQQGSSFYQTALVADHDFIMPTANQLNFWPGKTVKRVDGYHFLFYSYRSWDEIVGEIEGWNTED
jgi:pimeloyl-[acyl-carrier protein] methyl ester esterase